MALAEDAADNRLVVSVAPAFAARWLVPRLSRFYAAHPEIMLRIDASTRLADLDRSDVDLAIRMGDGNWPGVHGRASVRAAHLPGLRACHRRTAEAGRGPRA